MKINYLIGLLKLEIFIRKNMKIFFVITSFYNIENNSVYMNFEAYSPRCFDKNINNDLSKDIENYCKQNGLSYTNDVFDTYNQLCGDGRAFKFVITEKMDKNDTKDLEK